MYLLIFLPSSTLHLRDTIYSYIHCKWTIGSPDMAIFVGILLTKPTSGEIKDFRSKSKKIISYILVLCFLMLGSHSMLHGNQVFFSILIFLFQNLLFWSFFQGNIKLFSSPYSFIVYILVDIAYLCPSPKSVTKRFA